MVHTEYRSCLASAPVDYPSIGQAPLNSRFQGPGVVRASAIRTTHSRELIRAAHTYRVWARTDRQSPSLARNTHRSLAQAAATSYTSTGGHSTAAPHIHTAAYRHSPTTTLSQAPYTHRSQEQASAPASYTGTGPHAEDKAHRPRGCRARAHGQST